MRGIVLPALCASISILIAGSTLTVELRRPSLAVLPCNLSDVRIHDDTFFGAAQIENTKYLQYLDVDRLLYNFRLEAGLDPWIQRSLPYGGWIANESLVAGHFTGHWLSATAFTVAATGDAIITARSKYMVSQLAECQQQICRSNSSLCGWLSAYSFEQIIALEQHEGRTWATYYTIHKVTQSMQH